MVVAVVKMRKQEEIKFLKCSTVHILNYPHLITVMKKLTL